ncbi:MAG: protoporphyrinogen oxidase, partial [Chloroflexota bacterium]
AKHAQKNGKASKAAPSLFTSYKGGMENLVDGVVGALTGDLRLNAMLCALREMPDGGFELTLRDGEHLHADRVILALPAYQTANLLEPLCPEATALLNAIPYVDTGTVSLVYRIEDIPVPLDGFGMVVPRSEKRQINAITVSSTKFDGRAPGNLVLMRVFFGGARTPHVYDMTDDGIIETVQRELQDITGVTACPLVTRVVRNPRATPQYDVGHLDRIAAAESGLPDGLHLAGSAYYGVGVPDCVHQSQLVVERLANSR